MSEGVIKVCHCSVRPVCIGPGALEVEDEFVVREGIKNNIDWEAEKVFCLVVRLQMVN